MDTLPRGCRGRRGFAVSVRAFATRLEESGGLWTGRVLGEPMMGEAKARAALRLADECGNDLAHSYAYGDTASDRWLMRAVGIPAAVNPTWRLARIARANRWPIVRWCAAPGAAAKQRGASECGEMSLCRRMRKTT